ncbi:uncharacterized protein BKA78DRAFT_349802 [Phyllosticta capitalensis]|uniref:uncharacterized protein n=1 Tax=Phyllosticta capitalensis TaxID=121624 RepID=UPI00312F7CEA
MDFFKTSLFRSEHHVSTGPLYLLLMAYSFKPPSIPAAQLRLVPPWLQSPRPAVLLLVVLVLLIFVLPALTHFSRRTFTVAKILWKRPDPAPLGLADLVLLPGKGYTDRCFCPRRTGPWTPGRRILKKHTDVCVNRKPKTVSFPADAALVDVRIPAWTPTPKSPWKPGRSILYDAKSRGRPAKSVSFDPVPKIREIPARKRVHFDPEVHVKIIDNIMMDWNLYPKWQNEVMRELVSGHARRELRDIGQRDSDGDMEMDDAPRKKVRWDPNVQVKIVDKYRGRDEWYYHWKGPLLDELVFQRPKLRPVYQ